MEEALNQLAAERLGPSLLTLPFRTLIATCYAELFAYGNTMSASKTLNHHLKAITAKGASLRAQLCVAAPRPQTQRPARAADTVSPLAARRLRSWAPSCTRTPMRCVATSEPS